VTRPVNLFTGTQRTRLSGDGCCEAINGETKKMGDAADVVVGCRGGVSLPRCGRKRLLIGRGEVRIRTGTGSVKQAGGETRAAWCDRFNNKFSIFLQKK
jgi:hypothetical protein